jgi:superfamily II DNA/RNA helicase
MNVLKKIKTLFSKEESKKKSQPEHSKQGKAKRRKFSGNDPKPRQQWQDSKKRSPKKEPVVKNDKEKKLPKPAEKPSGKPFSELGLHENLVKILTKNNFINATNVQTKSIPVALSGKNIFCSSETGSGKTLSFLLPMIHKFYNKEIDQALILCPTREIAIQIEKTLRSFEDEGLTSCLVIGGTNMIAQKEALRQYPKILVATPGRLLDMLNTGLIWLNYTNYVVLDEADRMLDMGFAPDLLKIHEHFSGNQQTVLFSATLFPEVKKIAKQYASEYEEISVGNPTSVAKTIEHVVVNLSGRDKLDALIYLIKQKPGKMMVFFNTIKETSNITQTLNKKGMRNVACIHSKIDQSGREHIIEMFRENKLQALLASDVASRGIDIPNVEMVVNYDIPNNSEEYIHRVGRTGRAGNTGIAISFCSQSDSKKLVDIEKLIEKKIKRVSSYRDVI